MTEKPYKSCMSRSYISLYDLTKEQAILVKKLLITSNELGLMGRQLISTLIPTEGDDPLNQITFYCRQECSEEEALAEKNAIERERNEIMRWCLDEFNEIASKSKENSNETT